MSGEVDDRIVSMKFDNQAFEQKLTETITSLDKLRASLDLAGATRGMENVSAASKNFDLSHMSSGVEGVSAKFIALATIGITALSQLTSRAISAGTSFVKSFTFGPIMDGFQEFQTNMTSIQTILANTSSKGSTLENVNSALDQLNEYSDKTIYNFGEMARNIGTFTAAGVDLDTSVQSIKGIANLAAISGSNSQQASTAMYQLSQAIATGTVKLMDWNSVVNAGMGGEVFQKALWETGRAMGKLTNVPVGQTFDQWKKAGNSFRNSLSQSGAEGADSAEQVAKAHKDSAKAIAQAEESGAEAIKNADERVVESHESLAKTTKETAKQMEEAQKNKVEASKRAAQDITDAEKTQSEVFKNTAEDMAKAAEDQKQVLARNAEDVQKALDDVANAQKRLQDALKPASADDLQAATDALTSSQLDQKDAADDIEKAQRDQQRAAEDLAKAQADLAAKPTDPAAIRRAEDAQARVNDLADAVERAGIRQRAITRSVTDAEEKLSETKQKGTETDKNVIESRAQLSAAEENLVQVKEEVARREAEAEQRVKDVATASADARKKAIEDVAQARKDGAEREAEAAQRLADVTEQTSDRQKQAAKSVADAEKAAAKSRKDSAERIAEAHENAAERIKSASESASGGVADAGGWLTSDVLTATLKAFTGDLTEAQLVSMGYTKEQAAEMKRLGSLGLAAATEVKTLSQLLSTVKESIGSGWASSFRTVFGNFEESKQLFTQINGAISIFIGRSAEARNQLLQGWKDFGGRTALIEGFKNAFHNIEDVLRRVSLAFREIFPKTTSADLLHMTAAFVAFTDKLKMGPETIAKIHSAFRGFFALLSIGWEVVKGILGLFGGILGALSPAAGGVLTFSANIGDMIWKLQGALVEGGKIHKFFETLGEIIKVPIQSIMDFKDILIGLFTGFSKSEAAAAAVDKISARFAHLKGVIEGIGDFWHGLVDRLSGVIAVFEKIWDYIANWFHELGRRIADEMKPGDFDAAVDVVNVGLLGGIALMLKRFITKGFNMDNFLSKDILAAIQVFTDKMKLMQTELKAKILLEIAAAIGILAASLLVLSMINSADLTKALVAMGAGFAQLVLTMKAIDKFGGGGLKTSLIAAAMIEMATAMTVMSLAVKAFSTMSPVELATGLAGAAAGLTLMVTATRLMSTDAKGLIAGSVAMTAMATALRIMAEAVQAFATMKWGDMARGLTGAGAALAIITAAVNLMPVASTLAAGAAMIPLATGLLIMSKAVESFAKMDWGQLGKGLLGIFAVLVVIGGVMGGMPLTLPITAAGLVIVAGALVIMAEAVKLMGEIPFGEMAKSIGGFAVMLTILSAALLVMTGTAAGSASLLVASAALAVLTGVLIGLSTLSIAQLATGIIAIAAALTVIAVAALALTEAIPSMLGLGVAIAFIGGGFALFGAGALLVAKALQIIAKSGKDAAIALVEMVGVFMASRIIIIHALVDAFLSFAKDILNAAPLIIKSLKVILGMLLDTIIELTPKIAEALVTILTAGLLLIREKFPDILETGYQILLTLMKGIRDHIGEIITVGVEIFANFIAGIVKNIGQIITSAVSFVTSFTKAIGEHAAEIVGAGLSLLLNFILGISQNIGKVIGAVTYIITTFLDEIAGSIKQIIDAGFRILTNLLKGIGDNINKVVDTVGTIIAKFIEALGKNYLKIIDAGLKVLTDFLKGIGDNIVKITDKAAEVVAKFVEALGKGSKKIVDAGTAAIVDFLEGVANAIPKIAKAVGDIISAFLYNIALKVPEVTKAFFDMFITLFTSMADVIDQESGELGKAMGKLASALVKGIGNGIKEAIKEIVNELFPHLGALVGKVLKVFGISSPSKVFHWIGSMLMQGFHNGIMDNIHRPENALMDGSDRMVNAMSDAMKKASDALPEMGEFHPVITPVLDLSKVEETAKTLDRFMNISAITPEISLDHARQIATTKELENAASDTQPTGPTEISFTQNNYSPTALSVNDIYRNTKSQIALAKEELEIA